jgi:ABC-type bacteriocin/lantibiotic exporter with double-glycine peptidase domain
MGKLIDNPFFFQSAAHDCVPACVMAVSNYYRVPVNFRQLRSSLVTDPASGTTLKNMNNLAPWFKVQLGRIVNLSEIPTYTPFIAYLVHNHAVVVWGYTEVGNRLKVGDPAIGLVEMRLEELQRVWEGIAVVLRPLEEVSSIDSACESHSKWIRWLHLDELRALQIHWWSMAWVSLVFTFSGAANAVYSLYYAQFLPHFTKFILFIVAYTAVSGILSWISNLVQFKLSLIYQRRLAWRLEEALHQLDLKFYTMGDISTRYQDASTVISTVMGLFRDIPYSFIIFGASMYFLAKISWLLVVFTLAFLILLISILSPLVSRIRNMVYNIRIKQAEFTNKLKTWLSGGENMISSSFNEILGAQYKQSIWSIPISSVIGNSVVIPVLFLVIFLHWKQGNASSTTTAGYTQLLSGIMIMSYAVSAGHGLYQKIIAWQMALPSLQRLKDFLEVEMGTPSLNTESDREPLVAKREVMG